MLDPRKNPIRKYRTYLYIGADIAAFYLIHVYFDRSMDLIRGVV